MYNKTAFCGESGCFNFIYFFFATFRDWSCVSVFFFFLISAGTLCKSDLTLLSSWRSTLEEEEEKLLVDSGRRELREIGARFARRLPEIFRPVQKGLYKVRHTDKERTQSSSKEFINGAFAGGGEEEEEEGEDLKTSPSPSLSGVGVHFQPPVEDDPLLRASDTKTTTERSFHSLLTLSYML